MRGRFVLYIDQYGTHYPARNVKELKARPHYLPGKVSRMYIDKKNGKTMHVGYVIGKYWLTAYVPYETAS